jgi:YceI-like domain
MPVVRIPGYAAGTWDIDPVHPHIGFMAKHLMVSKVRRHFEKFQVQIVTAEDPLRSWATATVEVNSVITGLQTRDEDLRSDNFFAAATHPVIANGSTGIRRDGGNLVIDGELIIRGVTRPVSSALTAAELRLLPLLSTHLTFPQIGGEMFLSASRLSRRRCRSTASWGPAHAARQSPGPVSSGSWRDDHPVLHPIGAMELAPARDGLVTEGEPRSMGQGRA